MQLLSNFGVVFNKILDTANIDDVGNNSTSECSQTSTKCPLFNQNENINTDITVKTNNNNNNKTENKTDNIESKGESSPVTCDNSTVKENSTPLINNKNMETLIELRDLAEDTDSDCSSDSFIRVKVSSNTSSLSENEHNNLSKDDKVAPKASMLETSNSTLSEIIEEQRTTAINSLENRGNNTTEMSNTAVPVYHSGKHVKDCRFSI